MWRFNVKIALNTRFVKKKVIKQVLLVTFNRCLRSIYIINLVIICCMTWGDFWFVLHLISHMLCALESVFIYQRPSLVIIIIPPFIIINIIITPRYEKLLLLNFVFFLHYQKDLCTPRFVVFILISLFKTYFVPLII